eukprot:scaffold91_cov254-Pinguiococcus_pyrenoidosus.AAC.32
MAAKVARSLAAVSRATAVLRLSASEDLVCKNIMCAKVRRQMLTGLRVSPGPRVAKSSRSQGAVPGQQQPREPPRAVRPDSQAGSAGFTRKSLEGGAGDAGGPRCAPSCALGGKPLRYGGAARSGETLVLCCFFWALDSSRLSRTIPRASHAVRGSTWQPGPYHQARHALHQWSWPAKWHCASPYEGGRRVSRVPSKKFAAAALDALHLERATVCGIVVIHKEALDALLPALVVDALF